MATIKVTKKKSLDSQKSHVFDGVDIRVNHGFAGKGSVATLYIPKENIDELINKLQNWHSSDGDAK